MSFVKEILIHADARQAPLTQEIIQRAGERDVACRLVRDGEGSIERPLTIEQAKACWQVTTRYGFKVVKRGPGSANPACDYEIECVYGCPQRCAYCQQLYLVERVPRLAIYPHLDKVFARVRQVVAEEHRPLTFEMGNQTDLPAVSRRTGLLSRVVSFFTQELDGRARLQFLTKSGRMDELLGLEHKGLVRVGFSLNVPEVIRRYEQGTATLTRRLAATQAVLAAGYPVHLSFSPIMYYQGAERDYELLLRRVRDRLRACPGYDPSRVTLEAITLFHKQENIAFMQRYYPGRVNDLVAGLTLQNGRYAYPADTRDRVTGFFTRLLARYFPGARVLFVC